MSIASPSLSSPTAITGASTPTLVEMGTAARDAAVLLGTLSSSAREQAVIALGDALEAHAEDILQANREDVLEGRESGLTPALLDRLLLDQRRLAALAEATREVASLPDPVGVELQSVELPNGLSLTKRSVPLGVIGAIYEARPNVTMDIAALCLKTGNASILRGGKETIRTNAAMMVAIQSALSGQGLPAGAVQLIQSPDRRLVAELLRLDTLVDMIVPRGGAGLHRLCREQSTIPVMTGGIGVCHLFADASADVERAVAVIENAKVQRPTVCNSLDTLLVHPEVAPQLLPALGPRLESQGVTWVADVQAMALLEGAGVTSLRAADESDFDTEWLNLTLGVRIVADLDEAFRHIRAHSTQHSDGILTEDSSNAERFVQQVDSAAVYVNASTRFTDGGEFGLGAEVAVSTQKLHARGPMGLEALTTYKWIGRGDYLVRG